MAGALTKLDKATTMDMGLPQYFRGLALAELLPGGGPSEAELGTADTGRADQVIVDLELVLVARDQFPVGFLRAVYQCLARAYLVLGTAGPGSRGAATVRSSAGPRGTGCQCSQVSP